MINFVRHPRIFSLVFVFAFLLGLGQSASAQSLLLPDGGMNPLSNDFRYNIIGDLSVSDMLLAPTFVYQETEGADKSHSGFAPGQSYAAITWRRDRFLSAVFKVGSKTLIGIPARYAAPSTSDELGLIEAYGQVDNELGYIAMEILGSNSLDLMRKVELKLRQSNKVYGLPMPLISSFARKLVSK